MLWLQLPFHGIDPVFLQIGPLELRWYGLMYMFGFIVAYFIMRSVTGRGRLSLSKDDVYDLLFYLILGVMVGGRLGYVLIYDLGVLRQEDFSVLRVRVLVGCRLQGVVVPELRLVGEQALGG